MREGGRDRGSDRGGEREGERRERGREERWKREREIYIYIWRGREVYR